MPRCGITTVRLQVGALTVAYRGRVQLADVDAAAWRVKIVGEALEKSTWFEPKLRSGLFAHAF